MLAFIFDTNATVNSSILGKKPTESVKAKFFLMFRTVLKS